MERQIVGKAALPPFAQKLVDRGMREGKLEGKKETLLRLLAHAGIVLAEHESARIQACSDIVTLDRWIENVLGAKTATDVLS